MERLPQNTEILTDQRSYTAAYNDIEITDPDDVVDLDEIENFFREDFENNISEEPVF
ncbi:hypothetical protein KSK37_13380 [Kaistella sp. DKR-2]|uniref:hypothetical protein n=1 Tax=Kaistella soli TaxID=2849654 RepID=UPI001C25FA9F|nr:hypothetical protein [Kaistella soli]MBU8884080.1 hypothetical protein [Kaistella soli]